MVCIYLENSKEDENNTMFLEICINNLIHPVLLNISYLKYINVNTYNVQIDSNNIKLPRSMWDLLTNGSKIVRPYYRPMKL
jgi:hypothetical protein